MPFEDKRLYVVTGCSGSGKTSFLEELYSRKTEEEDREGKGNIIFVPSPSRMEPVDLRFYVTMPWTSCRAEALKLVLDRMPFSGSSRELWCILADLIERGILSENAVLLIDNVEEGVHPSSQKALLDVLVELKHILDLTLVFSTESILMVRAVELLDEDTVFLKMVAGEEEAVEALDEIYAELATGLEEL